MQQNTPQTPQVLAPAGSIEQLKAAVNNGCNCVYLGLEQFNARMKAQNFNCENLGEWVDYCHLFGVKVYVTINTSLKNEEFALAVDTLMCAYKNNADGVIVTDLALMRLAASLPKPFEVVASTQLNVHDKFGAQFVMQHGATTVVCSRECTLENIADVATSGVGVEVFIHGARCVCQSGQCLFSSLVGGNSGNRGLCAQPCRKWYEASNGAKGYLLSARDMCGVEVANDLLQAGATTFKIEGRNRRAEYAGITSAVYSQLFEKGTCTEADKHNLREMYNRDMSATGYLFGANDGIVYTHSPNHIGVRVGKVVGKHIALDQGVTVSKGDGFKIFNDKTEVCGAVAMASGSGKVTAEFSGKVADGMLVHRTTSVDLCNYVNGAQRRKNVQMKFVAHPNQLPMLTAYCDGVSVSVSGASLTQLAQNAPLSRLDLCQQLQKTGNLYYTITDIVTDIGNIFMPKAQINALRRDVLDRLSQQLTEKCNEQFANRLTVQTPALPQAILCEASSALAVTCYNPEQVTRCVGVADVILYKPLNINCQTASKSQQYGCFLDIPPFTDSAYLLEILTQYPTGIVCHNVGHVQLARQLNLPYVAGSGLNIFNDSMVGVFADAATFVYSHELTLAEISKFANKSGMTFVDGKFVVMNLVHCPFKVSFGGSCKTCKAHLGLTYTDQLGNSFAVERRVCSACNFQLVNGKKLSAGGKIRNPGRYIVDFDEKIIQHYLAINAGSDSNYVETAPYTKGRLFSKIN